MSVIRVGTSSKYATGWDAVFGGAKPRAAGRKTVAVKSQAQKGVGKKTTVKKVAKKTGKKSAKRR